MPKGWENISDDEILNYDSDHIGHLHRFERIMQKKSIDALNNVRDKLTGLMETIYRASQNLGGKTDEITQLYEKISRSQARQQKILIGLFIIIACSTVVYTGITLHSVATVREANRIQNKFLKLELRKFQQTQKPKISKEQQRGISGGRN